MSRPTSMKVGGTVYWTLMTYDADGILVDADSTPTVSVRKNGASVGDAVTVTKRAATTGIYDCSHNPAGEAEGDTFGYEESVTISSQAYTNPWSLEVEALESGGDATAANQTQIIADIAALNDFNPAVDAVANVTLVDTVTTNTDMRGTDGANTVAPDNSSIAAILVDTNELQQNQGDWATATTVVASNMRGTDNALLAASAPANWSILSINGSGQVDTTGSGSGGDSAATIYSYFTSSNREDAFKATGFNTVAPDNASIAAILADTDELQQNQGDWATATTVIASNMRGTDNALLAASAPTNWSVMLINGSGEITTSNPASGGGSGHTAEDVRDLILAGDKTPIAMATGSVSNVVLVDTTTTLTNQPEQQSGSSPRAF